ncbi:hypothetical protein ACJX0J_030402 [Zea mays]
MEQDEDNNLFFYNLFCPEAEQLTLKKLYIASFNYPILMFRTFRKATDRSILGSGLYLFLLVVQNCWNGIGFFSETATKNSTNLRVFKMSLVISGLWLLLCNYSLLVAFLVKRMATVGWKKTSGCCGVEAIYIDFPPLRAYKYSNRWFATNRMFISKLSVYFVTGRHQETNKYPHPRMPKKLICGKAVIELMGINFPIFY